MKRSNNVEQPDNTRPPDDVGQPDSTRPSADTESPDNTETLFYDVQLPNDSEEPIYDEEPPDDMEPPDGTGQSSSQSQSSNTGQNSTKSQSGSTGQSSITWQTQDELVNNITDDYRDMLKKQPRSSWPTPEWIGIHVVRDMESIFMAQNILRGKGPKLTIPKKMLLTQIALFMTIMFYIIRISCEGGDPDRDALAIYMDDGEDKGVYVQSRIAFHQMARRFSRNLLAKECDAIIEILRTSEAVPRVTCCTDRDLIAVNNGIFDYRTKELIPFSPEYVFLAKSRVDYNPNAKNVTIHNDDDGTDWDVVSWIEELTDDPEIRELIWQLLGAIIRPYVSWNKSAWLYAVEGNNGKGTLCVLMKNLCGKNSAVSITIEEFSKEFGLEPLIGALAVITDENPVGTFVDAADKLKAVITGDAISINRKGRPIINYQFRGFVVQCLNEFPRVRDKSNSFYRRQLFIPFDKCFTGKEREYIKADYLNRKEVLEYVLYKVLNMNYYKLSEPQRCKDVLEKFKKYNDPVREFFQEMERKFTWRLLPFKFLYPLYKAWFSRNCPNGKVQGRNTFIEEVINASKDSQIWHHANQNPIRSAGRMNLPEPLILEYDLKDWMNPNHSSSSDATLLATTVPKKAYRGLTRREDTLDDSDFTEDTGD